MTTASRAAAAGAVAALTVASVMVAPADGARPAQVKPAAETLRFIIHERVGEVVDLPPRGDSTGDVFTWTGPAYDNSHHRRIGRFNARCELTLGSTLCHTTVVIEGRGKVVFTQTNWPNSRKYVVVGGSGYYTGVGGQGSSEFLDNGHGAVQPDFRFRLRLVR